MRQFEISDDAVRKIREVVDLSNEPKTVRFFVNGMSCYGPGWGLAFDEQSEADTGLYFDNLTVIMENALLDALGGVKIEYDEWDGGFNVIPQADDLDFGAHCGGNCDGCCGCSGGGCGGCC